jgi:hypothetical protein
VVRYQELIAVNASATSSSITGYQGKALGFYEAEFVKTRCENSFFLFLIHFGRRLATTYLLGFGA